MLGHAYEKSGQWVTLYVYDPNFPGKSTALRFEMSDTAGAVHMTRTPEGEQPSSNRIFCMFRTNGYTPRTAPQGRRHQSVRAGIIAVATMRPTVLSVRRSALPGPNGVISVTGWLRSL